MNSILEPGRVFFEIEFVAHGSRQLVSQSGGEEGNALEADGGTDEEALHHIRNVAPVEGAEETCGSWKQFLLGRFPDVDEDAHGGFGVLAGERSLREETQPGAEKGGADAFESLDGRQRQVNGEEVTKQTRGNERSGRRGTAGTRRGECGAELNVDKIPPVADAFEIVETGTFEKLAQQFGGGLVAPFVGR